MSFKIVSFWILQRIAYRMKGFLVHILMANIGVDSFGRVAFLLRPGKSRLQIYLRVIANKRLGGVVRAGCFLVRCPSSDYGGLGWKIGDKGNPLVRRTGVFANFISIFRLNLADFFHYVV